MNGFERELETKLYQPTFQEFWVYPRQFRTSPLFPQMRLPCPDHLITVEAGEAPGDHGTRETVHGDHEKRACLAAENLQPGLSHGMSVIARQLLMNTAG